MILDFDFDNIDTLITWAKENVITEKMLYDIKLNKIPYPEDSHLTSEKFDLWYTIEEQPIDGVCQHVILAKTVSLTKKQNYALIKEVLDIFFINIEDVINIAFEGAKLHIHARVTE